MAEDVMAEYSTIIKFYAKLGKRFTEIKDDLLKVLKIVKPCTHKWRHRFSDGRKSTKDDTHRGCLVTQTTEENMLLCSHMQ